MGVARLAMKPEREHMAQASGLARKINRPGSGGGSVYLSEIVPPRRGGFFSYVALVVGAPG